MARLKSTFLALIFAGCTGSGAQPGGSSALVTSVDADALFVANSDHESIARFDLETQAVEHIPSPGEPTRIARVGSRLFVTLRAARSVGVFDGADGVPTPVTTLEVGPEPFGIVADDERRRVYVSVSIADEIVEIDADSLEILRRWSVPGEPRGLALHPSGAALFAVSFRSRELRRLDLEVSDAISEVVALPDMVSWTDRTNVLRLTGDPAVAPNGELVHVPGVYLNVLQAIPTIGNIGSYYAETAQPVPVVVAVPLDDAAVPAPSDAAVISVIDYEATPAVAGAPSGVAVSPDSELLAVSIQGADAVVVVGADHDTSDSRRLRRAREGAQYSGWWFRGGRHIGLEPRAVASIGAPAGPQSVVFTGNREAWSYGFLARAVSQIDVGDLDPIGDSLRFTPGTKKLALPISFEVAPEVLPLEVEAGRRKFYSATDPEMTRPGMAVSCALCHVDGRDDGLTWTFDIGARQTPSLGGLVSMTEPVRWQGQRETVVENTIQTARGMSGSDLISHTTATKVAAYIDWARAPDAIVVDNDIIMRGRAVFERIGCATCHAGPALTDNVAYEMFGLDNVRTRSLIGVGASAPYLHDGSAETLRDVIDLAAAGRMGAPFTLSNADYEDLTRYLESL